MGALLRREGLYSSHLANWRRQREQGELITGRARKRGPLPTMVDSRLRQLEVENRRLQRKLARAETIITLQKKLSGAPVPRYLVDQKLPVRLSSRHPGFLTPVGLFEDATSVIGSELAALDLRHSGSGVSARNVGEAPGSASGVAVGVSPVVQPGVMGARVSMKV